MKDLTTEVPLVFRGHFSSSAQLQKCLEKWKNEASAVGADVSPEGLLAKHSTQTCNVGASERVETWQIASESLALCS